ncbi:MAG: hypothetical protein JNN07_16995 [Verrucomicrobiales bacterium]|nr:hypothetical protein [Verrucomicrobiales bacterium]
MYNHAPFVYFGRWLWVMTFLLLWGGSGSADTFTIAWEPPATGSVVAYKIYNARSSGEPFIHVATTDTTYARRYHPGSAQGQLYYVTALDAEGMESLPSNIIEIGKTLGIRVEPDLLIFQWNDEHYELETAPTPEGPWTLHTTGSPAFSDTSQGMQFFRLRDR